MVLFDLVFVILFGGVGLGGLTGLAFVRRKVRRMDEARKLHPDEPWTWDADMADGRFRPLPRWVGCTVFAVFCNAIGSPIPFLFFAELMRQGPSLFWFCFVLPLIGLGTLWKAGRELRKRFRYGLPVVTIQPWPFFVGDPMIGVVEFPREVPASPELVIELRVFETNSGDGPDTEHFKETTRVPLEGSRCTFQIATRANLPRTELLNEDAEVPTANWQLKVTGSEGARDFEATYQLAVFTRVDQLTSP